MQLLELLLVVQRDELLLEDLVAELEAGAAALWAESDVAISVAVDAEVRSLQVAPVFEHELKHAWQVTTRRLVVVRDERPL